MDCVAERATEYIINDKDHPEFFNRKTIYSDIFILNYIEILH